MDFANNCGGLRIGPDRRTFLKTVGVGGAALAAHRYARAASPARPRICRVHHVPVPDYSYSNRHAGVESLLYLLASDGIAFYASSSGHPLAAPGGLIGRDDVVLIKVNAQWKYRGSTNTDVVRGVIRRILEHPDGFAGEVVIVENGQGRGSLNCDTTAGCDGGTREVQANAENVSHSFSYLVRTVFNDPRVSEKLLDDYRTTFIAANDHVTQGYRTVGRVSYPCFNTTGGRRVEMREGLWTGAAHDSARLKWINVPTMKDHKDLNVTGCLKNTFGLITTYMEPLAHHDPTPGGQAMGEFFTLVRPPALNILDHIWCAHASLCGYPSDTTTRVNMLCAGLDPAAMDAWSARHILMPISGDPAHDPDIPGFFRTYLENARETINANGGLYGSEVTFDAALTTARHLDQREIVTGVQRLGPDLKVTWAGGTPPYRLERSADSQFSAPQLVANGLMVADFVDAGAGTDGRTWFYRVLGL